VTKRRALYWFRLQNSSEKNDSFENTGFFSAEFLQNYDAIAKGIDTRLKTNKDEWMVGDMPPFGEDANPWCRCQDYLMIILGIKLS
jgi:hypothetical protein